MSLDKGRTRWAPSTDLKEKLVKAFEELKSRGVTFETGVLEYPWGLVAVFVDPDGNRLQLREGRQAQ
jgi:predicted enzyme related to lactoylglutathione lyase